MGKQCKGDPQLENGLVESDGIYTHKPASKNEEPGNLSFLDLRCKIFCSISPIRNAEGRNRGLLCILPLPVGCSRCLEKECQKQDK